MVSISLWLAAPLIGLVLSLFAAGGGMIAVPLLSFGIGMPLKQAIATSLIIVACVSLIAGKYSSGRLQMAFSLMLTLMAGWMIFKAFTH